MPENVPSIHPQMLEVQNEDKNDVPCVLGVFCAEAVWTQVMNLMEDPTGLALGNDPVACLLHIMPMSCAKYKRSLLRHLLNATKTCITIYWKRMDPPLYNCESIECETELRLRNCST